MSTQRQPDDLDQTDELPQLDIVAYEAEHGFASQRRATNDTWLVESLHNLGSPGGRELHGPQTRPLMTGSADLSISIDPLRQRIATLEVELKTARNAADRTKVQLQSLTADRVALEARVASMTAELGQLREERSVIKQSTEQLRNSQSQSAAIEQRQQELLAEIASLRETLQSTAAERDALLETREQLAQQTKEFEAASVELASVQRDARIVRAELETQSKLAADQQRQLGLAQQAIDELQLTRDELQRALAEAQRNIERLQTASHDEVQLLSEHNSQLAALRTQLDSQRQTQQGLELELSARDKLIEDLRSELRTVQEERASMTGQLENSHARTKMLTQQLLERDGHIAALKADLAVHTEALAAIRRDVDRIDPAEALPRERSERILEPVNHEGQPIVLNRRVMTIGRTNDNDICVPSKMISRHHARLMIGPNAVIVEDAGSTNGCFVNDQQVKQHVLHERDVLTIGDLKFRLSVRGTSGSAA